MKDEGMAVIEDPLNKLDGVELVQLAMLAFLHMRSEKILPDDQLLDQILLWFDAMTDTVVRKEAHEVHEMPRRVQ